jgi:hypothetical protein
MADSTPTTAPAQREAAAKEVAIPGGVLRAIYSIHSSWRMLLTEWPY